jgi:hypothetical protein
MRIRSCWLGLLCLLLATIAPGRSSAGTNRRIETGIADSLLSRLANGNILVLYLD